MSSTQHSLYVGKQVNQGTRQYGKWCEDDRKKTSKSKIWGDQR